MTNAPTAKNIVRICPLLSSAISWDKDGVRHHDLARSPCIRGECELFDIATFGCSLKRVKP